MRAAYHAPVCPWAVGCGFMIHHNQDSGRHEVFGVKEFKKQQSIDFARD